MQTTIWKSIENTIKQIEQYKNGSAETSIFKGFSAESINATSEAVRIYFDEIKDGTASFDALKDKINDTENASVELAEAFFNGKEVTKETGEEFQKLCFKSVKLSTVLKTLGKSLLVSAIATGAVAFIGFVSTQVDKYIHRV